MSLWGAGALESLQKLPLRAVAAASQSLRLEAVRHAGAQPAQRPEGLREEALRLVLRSLPAWEYVPAGTEES